MSRVNSSRLSTSVNRDAVSQISGSPELPSGFAYNAQQWLVMQPVGQDSPIKICSWLQVAARTRDPQGGLY